MTDKRDLENHEHVDDGLKMAFGASSGSVLDAIESRAGIRSRIHLRDAPEDASPILRVAARGGEQDDERASDDSRYQIVGEIARGGVGVVYKGRDKDLGRDVALKVLQSRFMQDEKIVQRFIEEAQVGGQLQHPGIVPIYGLGLQAGGQPCFAMKLVKGETLSALIEQGKRASELLVIFEQVAQTVAYAHSRGVIHRDLKPANVMVGAFGEVQVVDWGFAKVLGREDTVVQPGVTTVATVRTDAEGSQSVAGSVMGTPAYMPPEQAMGLIDELTERSDVFALGAILCEVLTGKPPYSGTMHDQLLAAAQSRLDDAHRRLDECSAPEAVKRLARDCMAPLPQDRPADAGVVAQRLAEHLAIVEERAREAELDAVHAAAAIRDARRAKRTTLTLAAIALVALLGGGVGYAAWTGAERDRAERAAAKIAPLLRDATRLEALEQWRDARATATAALNLAETGGADPETLAATRTLQLRIARQAEQAATLDRKRNREVELLRTLDELAIQRMELSAAQLARGYDRAFREFRVDVDGEGARTLADFGDPVALASHLDLWSDARRADPEGPDGTRLERLSRAIDPNPWRERLRDTLHGGSPETRRASLRALAASDDADGQPAASLVRLANALDAAGDLEGAVAILRRARIRHPGDFWVHHGLATLLWWRLRRAEEALHHAKPALALRPESAAAWNMLGAILNDGLGDHDGALRAFEQAIRLDPGLAWAHTNMGLALRAKGDLDGAIAKHRDAIRTDPLHFGAYANLGNALQEKGDLDAAIAAHREAIRLVPAAAPPHNQLGVSLLRNGDVDAAIAAFREAIRLDPKLAPAHSNLGVALTDARRYDEAIAAFSESLRLDPTEIGTPINHGNALLGKGDVDGAIAKYREAIGRDPDNGAAYKNLAKALHRKGDNAGAVAAFQEVVRVGAADFNTHYMLGVLLSGAFGRHAEAIEHLRETIRIDPNRGDVHFNLGTTLHAMEDLDGAVAAYREALRIAPDLRPAHKNLGLALGEKGALRASAEAYRAAAAAFPNDAEIRHSLAEAERAEAALARVPAVLAGKDRPATAEEWRELAEVTYRTGDYESSARFWKEALSQKPELGNDIRTGDRYNAACSAALAGDPWREQARTWLRADLDALRALPAEAATMVAQSLQHWQRDPDLASVRDADGLSDAWKKLWADVEALRKEVSQ